MGTLMRNDFFKYDLEDEFIAGKLGNLHVLNTHTMKFCNNRLSTKPWRMFNEFPSHVIPGLSAMVIISNQGT